MTVLPGGVARAGTKRLIAAALVLISSLASVAFVAFREVRIRRLSTECATYATREDWPRLEAVARQWTQLHSDPAAWFWLGTSLKEQLRFGEAKQAFANVPVEGIRGIDAAVERLEIQYHIENRPLEALELARDLLQRDPSLASPRRHLIHFCAMTFQRPELIRQVRQAIDHHVDIPEHYIYLFLIEDLSFRDAQDVTALWTLAAPESQFLRRVHQMHRLRFARGAATSSPTPELMQKFQIVRREIGAAFERSTTDPVVLDTLLLLAVDSGDVDEVGRLLALVPETAGDDPVFWRYRGWYATRNGNYESAADSYLQALKLHPLGWQTRHEYSTALRLDGKVQAAGKQQAVSALGSELSNDIRRLPYIRTAPPGLMQRLAGFARECGAWELANGIIRRQQIGDSPHAQGAAGAGR
jgi:tetratricopeptide (TPR) repeat protein